MLTAVEKRKMRETFRRKKRSQINKAKRERKIQYKEFTSKARAIKEYLNFSSIIKRKILCY